MNAGNVVAMRDSRFEATRPGTLAPTDPGEGWEVQCTGRDAIKTRLVAACVENVAKHGSTCLSPSLPADTRRFEFVTVGQQLQLDATKTYEASIGVRWPDGTEAPPAGATSGHRS
jgi:hypothetical protein